MLERVYSIGRRIVILYIHRAREEDYILYSISEDNVEGSIHSIGNVNPPRGRHYGCYIYSIVCECVDDECSYVEVSIPIS